MRWLFVFAYACSGLAGLVYEVSWTRLLTLYLGHTTAAASAVVGAFLAGLAAGAALGGRLAARLSERQSLRLYVGLELSVIVAALALPVELRLLTPLVEWAYQDGAPGAAFAALRVLACGVMVFVPATALGATFPVATQWYAATTSHPAQSGGWLYALNTAGAAAGAVLAGFVLIPAIGLNATLGLAMATTLLAAIAAWMAGRPRLGAARAAGTRRARRGPLARQVASHEADGNGATRRRWLATVVLGVTGFAALIHEIAWTRILALVLGPTIYAFAATLAAVIGGVAIGAAIGAVALGRVRRQSAWLGLTLAAATLTTAITYALAGRQIPSMAAAQAAVAHADPADPLRQGLIMTAALIVPTAICLGAAFPLALAMAGATAADASRRFGLVYAVNTIGSVSGSLAAGFLVIPWIGLQGALVLVSACLAAATIAVLWSDQTGRLRVGGTLLVAVSAAWMAASPPWDRALLASGAYLYAPFVPPDLDLETQLRAGSLLYYREGASSTVSVKRLTGTTLLAVDGKTDASNRGDMLTQKLAAHLPLLLHDTPRDIGIIGLGSGVTLGAALRHPIIRADVIEISHEVVEASAFFEAENGHALRDPRTRLIVGDGRSHLTLARRQYDVLISEPSNPWIAGVAALFTREFFQAARDRLAPGGLLCQWANAYTINDADLRSIIGTFAAVFPDATVWLVGDEDVLLVGSAGGQPVSERLDGVVRHWFRPAVGEDLDRSSVHDPFSLLSLFVAGPGEIVRYTAGAAMLTDDRMSLEFSGPRDMHRRDGGDISAALRALLPRGQGPEVITRAYATAGAREWRHRAAMMSRRDAHAIAYDDYMRAVTLDRSDAGALDGFVRTAILLDRSSDALVTLRTVMAGQPPSVARLVAISKLQAASAETATALATAREATRLVPPDRVAFEQVASLTADAGDVAGLAGAVSALEDVAPGHVASRYYAAVLALLRDRPAEAAQLGEEAIAIDSGYAPVYDLVGAAYTRLDRPVEARQAFEKSLTFDARDSTAYTNLGLLALAAGDRDEARGYFAEALWLTPDSTTARAGLARTRE